MSDINIPEMSIKDTLQTMMANAHLQISGKDMAVPYMIGPPGVGKTRFLESECERLNVGFISFHFALIPIEEIGGLPTFKKVNYFDQEITGTEWSLPDVMTKVYETSKKYKNVIIFLDDFHMCSPAHLSLGYEMFTERKLRGFKIPDNCAFILAGNDSVKSGVKQMFGAIINRFAIYKVKPDFDQWVSEYAIPNKVNGKIITFLKAQVNRGYFLGEESTNEPWPSPRAWSRFSELLNSMEEFIKDISQEQIMYNSYAHVGRNAAAEFTAYYNIYSKTEMDKVFDGKKKISVPDSTADTYIYGMAASNECVSRFLENNELESGPTKTKNKKEIIDIMADIIIEISRANIDIGVSMLKNVIDYGNALKGEKAKLPVTDIMKVIREKNVQTDKKLTESITNILGAIAG